MLIDEMSKVFSKREEKSSLSFFKWISVKKKKIETIEFWQNCLEILPNYR
jgi:hypothetical protein